MTAQRRCGTADRISTSTGTAGSTRSAWTRVGQPGPGLRWFGLDGVEHTGGSLADFGADARAQVRLLDSDGDGLADRAITSGDNSVTGYVDTDGDGRWDVKLIDTDGDGAADAASALAPKT